MVDNVVRCEIRDTDRDTAVKAMLGEIEGVKCWRIADVEHIEPGPQDDGDGKVYCDGPEQCYPGHPCPRCQVTAVKYWHRHEAGKTQRVYKPCNEKIKIPGRCNSEDYCTHRKGHATMEEAQRCAKRGKWTHIRVYDGNWHPIDLVDAFAPAPGQVEMFGGPHA